MTIALWDASALAKRYVPEPGSETAGAIWGRARNAVALAVYAETYSVIVRRWNQGRMSRRALSEALFALRDDVLSDTNTLVFSAADSLILEGIPLIGRHNINASDAALLSTYLRCARSRAILGDTCLLVASDARFVRAARAEGLEAIDPETLGPEAAQALLTR